MGREHSSEGGFHPLSLEAEGSLPAARASAPSADRAHTTHYQQRPPSFTRGRRGGLCVCVCALTTDFTAERRGFSVVDQPHATDQQPRTPAFWEIFPEKSIYPGF